MKGILRKLIPLHQTPIHYQLPIGNDTIHVNPYLGKKISFTFTGKIFCVACSKPTNKSFHQGYCYRCFRTLAECDTCLMSPELCHYRFGTCRQPEWGETHCLKPHVVYLSNTSAIKVGIARVANIPSRWIDQGATQALPIFTVQTRYQSGLLEMALKAFMADKTNWRVMLKGHAADLDLQAERDQLFAQARAPLDAVRAQFPESDMAFMPQAKMETFDFPILEFPKKVESLSFDKTPTIAGTLLGIKGQYLLFDTGVLNIRKFSGYEVEF